MQLPTLPTRHSCTIGDIDARHIEHNATFGDLNVRHIEHNATFGDSNVRHIEHNATFGDINVRHIAQKTNPDGDDDAQQVDDNNDQFNEDHNGQKKLAGIDHSAFCIGFNGVRDDNVTDHGAVEWSSDHSLTSIKSALGHPKKNF